MTEQPIPKSRSENEATAGWLTVAAAVMDGQLAPRTGVERLQALQAQYPADAGWLGEQIATLRWTFALDVEDVLDDAGAAYWDKLLSVTEALVEERVTPRHAVALLERVRAQYPEQDSAVQKVIDDVTQSPLWQMVSEAKG